MSKHFPAEETIFDEVGSGTHTPAVPSESVPTSADEPSEGAPMEVSSVQVVDDQPPEEGTAPNPAS